MDVFPGCLINVNPERKLRGPLLCHQGMICTIWFTRGFVMPHFLACSPSKLLCEAVGGAFDCEIDYAMLVKLYGHESEGQKRHSPARIRGTKREGIVGNPDLGQVATSYAERQNLTMRMRRFTRLTNAFSKKVENLGHTVSLHFMHYNFARIHQTLRVTPAMEAGVSTHVWSLEEIAALDD